MAPPRSETQTLYCHDDLHLFSRRPPAPAPPPPRLSGVVKHYTAQIELCVAAGDIKLGRLVHARLIKTALSLNTLLANLLTDMYSKCGSSSCASSSFDDTPHKNLHSFNTLLAARSREAGGAAAAAIRRARHLFDDMPQRNLVSYNTMISSLARYGLYGEALALFADLRKDGTVVPLRMDKFTAVSAAAACTGLADARALRQIHGAIVVAGIEMNLIVSNVMIDGYGKCGDSEASCRIFDRMDARDAVSWTSLIMSCAGSGRLAEARKVFDEMPIGHDAVSWTALISGHEQNGQEEVSLDLFRQMLEDEVKPTPFTLVSVLGACARLGLIRRGKEVHGYMARRCIGTYPFNNFACNALIDMYGKCGNMASATKVFDSMPKRDHISWNSIVHGFAHNGLGSETLMVFNRMIREGVRPTHVTLLGVLFACSHSGMVSEALRILNSMEKEHGLIPRPEHVAVIVDALGRNHRLEEAMDMLDCLHRKDSRNGVTAWGALLGACQVHGNVDVARKAAERLFGLEPSNGVRYATLANIYAAGGRWDDARRVRVVMKGKGLSKDVGCSWIEGTGGMHVFASEDKSHHETREIYCALGTLADQIKATMHQEGPLGLYGEAG